MWHTQRFILEGVFIALDIENNSTWADWCAILKCGCGACCSEASLWYDCVQVKQLLSWLQACSLSLDPTQPWDIFIVGYLDQDILRCLGGEVSEFQDILVLERLGLGCHALIMPWDNFSSGNLGLKAPVSKCLVHIAWALSCRDLSLHRVPSFRW